MITDVAQYIAGCLLRNQIIESEKLDIYIYGFEIMLSNIIGFLIAMVLGCIFRQVLECAVFMLTFVSMRSFSGGYHADTYLKCNSIFTVVILGVMTAVRLIHSYPIYVHFVVGLFYLLTVLAYAPIETVYKPLDVATRKKNRALSIIMSLCFTGASVLLRNYTFSFTIVIDMALLIVALSIIIEVLRKRGERNEKCQN